MISELLKANRMYSQNNEQLLIVGFFNGFVGTLLDIGANDGKTLSNSLALIEHGWNAALVEPMQPAFYDLWLRHSDNKNVEVYEFAITETTGQAIMCQSGELLGQGDKGLVSSLKPEETKRWKGVCTFTDEVVSTLRWKDFLKICKYKQFDFISIDSEGYDVLILEQMDLTALGCKLICVEHNGIAEAIGRIRSHCAEHGLVNEIGYNGENILLSK